MRESPPGPADPLLAASPAAGPSAARVATEGEGLLAAWTAAMVSSGLWSSLRGTTAVALVVIGRHADARTGEATLSNAELGEAAGISQSALTRVKREFKKLGLCECVPVPARTRYRLRLRERGELRQVAAQAARAAQAEYDASRPFNVRAFLTWLHDERPELAARLSGCAYALLVETCRRCDPVTGDGAALSRRGLGKRLGRSRVTVRRALARLQELGLLRREGSTVVQDGLVEVFAVLRPAAAPSPNGPGQESLP